MPVGLPLSAEIGEAFTVAPEVVYSLIVPEVAFGTKMSWAIYTWQPRLFLPFVPVQLSLISYC